MHYFLSPLYFADFKHFILCYMNDGAYLLGASHIVRLTF